MPSAGRNDPCPCGSGAKYKKCCLLRQSAVSLADDASAREGALAKLFRFSERPQFDGDREIARILFWGDRLSAMATADAQALLESDDAEAKFNTFFLFDVDIDGGRSVADMFLAANVSRLSAAERAFLERMRGSHLGLYEVAAVHRGEGMRVRDLWTQTETEVVERAASAQIVPWDVLGARIVSDSGGVARFEGGLYLYPAGDKNAILQELRRHHRRFVKSHPAADVRAFFRRHGMLFNYAWLDCVIQRPLPRVVTAEQDEVILSKVLFDLVDEDAVRTAFAARADLDLQDDGSFVWLAESEDGRRLLGTWVFEGARLLLETMSKQRAARGREWLEALTGEAVRHRATSYEGLAGALERRAREPRSTREAQGSTDESAELISEMQDRHYRAWLDQPVQALRNNTPRDAARSRSLRPLLMDVLKHIENQADRDRLAGRPAYDASWLWRELGLDHPARSTESQ